MLSLLTSCGVYHNNDGVHVAGGASAAWGRDHLIGMTSDDVQACIGIPSSRASRSDGGQLLEWTTSETSVPINLPLAMASRIPGLAAMLDVPVAAFAGSITAQIGGGSGRLMLVVDNTGIVRQVHMAGPADGLTGRDSLIGTDLIRGCQRDAAHQR